MKNQKEKRNKRNKLNGMNILWKFKKDALIFGGDFKEWVSFRTMKICATRLIQLSDYVEGHFSRG